MLYRKLLLLVIGFFVTNQGLTASTVPTQHEEGWRWRANLDTYLVSAESTAGAAAAETRAFYGPVQAQTMHSKMCQHEIWLTTHLAPSFKDANIGIAALTVVLQGENGYFAISDILKAPKPILLKRPRQPDQSEEDKIESCSNYFFPSKADAGLSVRTSLWVKPMQTAAANVSMWMHLKALSSDMAELKQALLTNFILPATKPSSSDQTFSNNFQHSEQKIIKYLWDMNAI